MFSNVFNYERMPGPCKAVCAQTPRCGGLIQCDQGLSQCSCGMLSHMLDKAGIAVSGWSNLRISVWSRNGYAGCRVVCLGVLCSCRLLELGWNDGAGDEWSTACFSPNGVVLTCFSSACIRRLLSVAGRVLEHRFVWWERESRVLLPAHLVWIHLLL